MKLRGSDESRGAFGQPGVIRPRQGGIFAFMGFGFDKRFDIRLAMRLGILSLLAWLVFGCIGDAVISDGGGTETGNGTLLGLVAYGNGQPAVNARVLVHSEGYLPELNPIEDPTTLSQGESQKGWTVRTDENGRFELHGLKAGDFVVEFRDDIGKAGIARVQLESDSAHALVLGDMHPVASVTGRLLLPGGLSAEGWVGVYGLEHATTTDVNGRFALNDLPEGQYTLHFQAKGASAGDMDLPKVDLASGETHEVGDFELPPKSCETLGCDSLQVQAILLASGVAAPWRQRVTLGFDSKGRKRVIELNLSGLGLTRLADGIGQVSALRKLDISQNVLPVLPVSLGHLRSLRSLNAYSNALRELPATLGNLASLASLNVRSNHLVALPESIGRLFALELFDAQDNDLAGLPASLLKLESLALALEGNALCSLSAEELSWIQSHDPAFDPAGQSCK